MDSARKAFLINFGIILYLSLPTCMFVFFWTNFFFSIPFVAIYLYIIFQGSRRNMLGISFLSSNKCDYYKLIIIMLIIMLWVYLSGIGKFVWQNWDHFFRNSLFEILVTHDWPVLNSEINNNVSLVYYVGFWLPAAFVGKLSGITAGYIAQYLWAVLGIIILYYILTIILNKIYIFTLIIFIFFSGLDIVGAISMGLFDNIHFASHIEGWSLFQYSSNTTQLFWVYNQAIPAWIFTSIFLNINNIRYMIFIYSLLFIYAPFPFVGLFPFVALKILLNLKKEKSDHFFYNKLFSIENFFGSCIIIPIIALYFCSNHAANIISVLSKHEILIYNLTLFILLEFMIFYVSIYKILKIDYILIISFVILLICPFVKIGNSIDFCMRVSIPSLVIICIYIIKSIKICIDEGRRKRMFLICLLLAIGAITPINEFNRTIYLTSKRIIHDKIVCDKSATNEEIFRHQNFIGNLYKTDLGGIIFRKNNFIKIPNLNTIKEKQPNKKSGVIIPWGLDGFIDK